MKTTAESTFPYQSGLELSVSPRWQPQLFADLTELQARRAKEVEHQQQLDKARGDRTDTLEDLIGNAAESIQAKLEQQHQTFRTSAVLDHLWIKRDLYGITRLPTRKVVQRVLVKHGLYIIGL